MVIPEGERWHVTSMYGNLIIEDGDGLALAVLCGEKPESEDCAKLMAAAPVMRDGCYAALQLLSHGEPEAAAIALAKAINGTPQT